MITNARIGSDLGQDVRNEAEVIIWELKKWTTSERLYVIESAPKPKSASYKSNN